MHYCVFKWGLLWWIRGVSGTPWTITSCNSFSSFLWLLINYGVLVFWHVRVLVIVLDNHVWCQLRKQTNKSKSKLSTTASNNRNYSSSCMTYMPFAILDRISTIFIQIHVAPCHVLSLLKNKCKKIRFYSSLGVYTLH